jgi:hypothetical protein
MEQTTDENNKAIALEDSPIEVQAIVTATQNVDVMQAEALEQVEEIDSSTPVAAPDKPASRTSGSKEQPLSNPLLDDPYEWDHCTITLVYALLPDQTVSISIHNHKDEPIVKTFVATEVPLPEKISGVMATLRAVWPDSTVSATVVLIPKPSDTTERTIVVSVRAGNDTPIVQTGTESNLPFPTQINDMLDELKALLPTRALKRIEKDAKTKIGPATKPVAKTGSKPATKPTIVAPAAVTKTQLSLF